MHLRVVFRQPGFPELLKPIPFHKLVVYFSFPTYWAVIEDVFLVLIERPFSALDYLFGLSPSCFQRPVAVELVAPTVLELSIVAESGQLNAKYNICYLLIGAILGGLLYILLDQLVNAKGGFLRKSVAVIQHFGKAEKKRKQLNVRKISAA